MKNIFTLLACGIFLFSLIPAQVHAEKLCVKNAIRVKKGRINLKRALSVESKCPKRTTEVTSIDNTPDIDSVDSSVKPALEGAFVELAEETLPLFSSGSTKLLVVTCPPKTALLGGTCPSAGFPIVLLDAKISSDGRVWVCDYENASNSEALRNQVLVAKALCAPL